MLPRFCMYCGSPLDDEAARTGDCSRCGQSIARPALADGRTIDDIRRIAARQRLMIWCVLAMLLVYALSVANTFTGGNTPVTFAICGVNLLLMVFLIVGVVSVQTALGTHIVMRVIGAILMLIPLIGLLSLLSTNNRATAILRAAGLRVGFMGVSDDEVERKLSPHRCHACGYNVTRQHEWSLPGVRRRASLGSAGPLRRGAGRLTGVRALRLPAVSISSSKAIARS